MADMFPKSCLILNEDDFDSIETLTLFLMAVDSDNPTVEMAFDALKVAVQLAGEEDRLQLTLTRYKNAIRRYCLMEQEIESLREKVKILTRKAEKDEKYHSLYERSLLQRNPYECAQNVFTTTTSVNEWPSSSFKWK